MHAATFNENFIQLLLLCADDATFLRFLSLRFSLLSSRPSDKWVCQGFFPIVLGLLPQTNYEEEERLTRKNEKEAKSETRVVAAFLTK